MPKPEPYHLTEVDLLDLRTRMARVGFISDGVSGVLAQAPWITYILSTHEYALHSLGFTVAVTGRDDVACYLLRAERLEPGYVRTILDPRTDVTVALQSPEARAAYHSARNAEAATRRAAEAEHAEAARRRRVQLRLPDPTTVDLADLF